jgi:hypothetical protein
MPVAQLAEHVTVDHVVERSPKRFLFGKIGLPMNGIAVDYSSWR